MGTGLGHAALVAVLLAISLGFGPPARAFFIFSRAVDRTRVSLHFGTAPEKRGEPDYTFANAATYQAMRATLEAFLVCRLCGRIQCIASTSRSPMPGVCC